MRTVFVELTGLAYDAPILVNPNYVVAVEGSYIHLFGSGLTVKEEHAEIRRLFARALGFEEVSQSTEAES